MIAHRPALLTPNLAARSFATLDHTTGGGRIRLHAITGITAEPQEGDYIVDKVQRYERTGEYLDIIQKLWKSDQPISYEGKYFKLDNAFCLLKPVNGTIPISFGGSSDIAYDIAVRHADLYSLWGEPLAGVKEQITKLKLAAEKPINHSLLLVYLYVLLLVQPKNLLGNEQNRFLQIFKIIRLFKITAHYRDIKSKVSVHSAYWQQPSKVIDMTAHYGCQQQLLLELMAIRLPLLVHQTPLLPHYLIM